MPLTLRGYPLRLMDKKSTQTEAKLQNLGAAPTKKEDPLADAKKAFQGALEKTKAQAKDEGIEEAVIIEQPKKEKAEAPKPKPEPKPEPSPELVALKAELAAMREQLKPKPEPEKPKASDFDSVQARLAEQFGDEEGEILAGALKDLLAPREQRIANLEQMIQRAVEQSKTVSAKTNRSRLAKDHPVLSDNDDAWEIVQERAQKLIGEGKHLTADDAYESVATALYGKPVKAHNEDAEELASRISASTPTQPSSARRERKLSPTEAMRSVFDHLVKNPDDVNGAKRLSKELRISHKD